MVEFVGINGLSKTKYVLYLLSKHLKTYSDEFWRAAFEEKRELEYCEEKLSEYYKYLQSIKDLELTCSTSFYPNLAVDLLRSLLPCYRFAMDDMDTSKEYEMLRFNSWKFLSNVLKADRSDKSLKMLLDLLPFVKDIVGYASTVTDERKIEIIHFLVQFMNLLSYIVTLIGNQKKNVQYIVNNCLSSVIELYDILLTMFTANISEKLKQTVQFSLESVDQFVQISIFDEKSMLEFTQISSNMIAKALLQKNIVTVTLKELKLPDGGIKTNSFYVDFFVALFTITKNYRVNAVYCGILRLLQVFCRSSGLAMNESKEDVSSLKKISKETKGNGDNASFNANRKHNLRVLHMICSLLDIIGSISSKSDAFSTYEMLSLRNTVALSLLLSLQSNAGSEYSIRTPRIENWWELDDALPSAGYIASGTTSLPNHDSLLPYIEFFGKLVAGITHQMEGWKLLKDDTREQINTENQLQAVFLRIILGCDHRPFVLSRPDYTQYSNFNVIIHSIKDISELHSVRMWKVFFVSVIQLFEKLRMIDILFTDFLQIQCNYSEVSAYFCSTEVQTVLCAAVAALPQGQIRGLWSLVTGTAAQSMALVLLSPLAVNLKKLIGNSSFECSAHVNGDGTQVTGSNSTHYPAAIPTVEQLTSAFDIITSEFVQLYDIEDSLYRASARYCDIIVHLCATYSCLVDGTAELICQSAEPVRFQEFKSASRVGELQEAIKCLHMKIDCDSSNKWLDLLKKALFIREEYASKAMVKLIKRFTNDCESVSKSKKRKHQQDTSNIEQFKSLMAITTPCLLKCICDHLRLWFNCEMLFNIFEGKVVYDHDSNPVLSELRSILESGVSNLIAVAANDLSDNKAWSTAILETVMLLCSNNPSLACLPSFTTSIVMKIFETVWKGDIVIPNVFFALNNENIFRIVQYLFQEGGDRLKQWGSHKWEFVAEVFEYYYDKCGHYNNPGSETDSLLISIARSVCQMIDSVWRKEAFNIVRFHLLLSRNESEQKKYSDIECICSGIMRYNKRGVSDSVVTDSDWIFYLMGLDQIWRSSGELYESLPFQTAFTYTKTLLKLTLMVVNTSNGHSLVCDMLRVWNRACLNIPALQPADFNVSGVVSECVELLHELYIKVEGTAPVLEAEIAQLLKNPCIESGLTAKPIHFTDIVSPLPSLYSLMTVSEWREEHYTRIWKNISLLLSEEQAEAPITHEEQLITSVFARLSSEIQWKRFIKPQKISLDTGSFHHALNIYDALLSNSKNYLWLGYAMKALLSYVCSLLGNKERYSEVQRQSGLSPAVFVLCYYNLVQYTVDYIESAKNVMLLQCSSSVIEVISNISIECSTIMKTQQIADMENSDEIVGKLLSKCYKSIVKLQVKLVSSAGALADSASAASSLCMSWYALWNSFPSSAIWSSGYAVIGVTLKSLLVPILQESAFVSSSNDLAMKEKHISHLLSAQKCIRCVASCRDASLGKVASLYILLLVDTLSNFALLEPIRYYLLPGIFILFDKITPKQRQALYNRLSPSAKLLLTEIRDVYMREYKFTGYV